jgi:hypothetical protein
LDQQKSKESHQHLSLSFENSTSNHWAFDDQFNKVDRKQPPSIKVLGQYSNSSTARSTKSPVIQTAGTYSSTLPSNKHTPKETPNFFLQASTAQPVKSGPLTITLIREESSNFGYPKASANQ